MHQRTYAYRATNWNSPARSTWNSWEQFREPEVELARVGGRSLAACNIDLISTARGSFREKKSPKIIFKRRLIKIIYFTQICYMIEHTYALKCDIQVLGNSAFGEKVVQKVVGGRCFQDDDQPRHVSSDRLCRLRTRCQSHDMRVEISISWTATSLSRNFLAEARNRKVQFEA